MIPTTFKYEMDKADEYKKNLSCNQCSLRFVEESILDSHSKIIHGSKKSTISVVILPESEKDS